MRAIAILLVVATHSWHALPVWTTDVPYILLRHVNLMFIFVAGYLFQYLLGRYSYADYLRGKLLTVLLPYALVSIPLILIYVLGLRDPEPLNAPAWIDENKLLLTIYMLATGTHLAPFWFIPVVAMIYVMMPLLRFIDERPVLYLVILPLLVLSAFAGRPVEDDNPLRSLAFYLPSYMIGMVACHFRGRIAATLQRFWPLLLLIPLAPLAWSGSTPLFDYAVMLSKIALCFGAIGMLSLHAHRLPGWFNTIGDLSFGIYFVHGYLTVPVAIVAKQNELPLQGLFGFLAVFAFALIGSVLIVLAVKRLFGPWSRRVIGA